MQIEDSDKPKFTILKWNAVAVWSWNTHIETCSICKQLLTEVCLVCSEEEAADESTCQPVWGKCSHPFHAHCIQRWTENANTCPLCARPWEVKTGA
jgi:hypothetical protein